MSSMVTSLTVAPRNIQKLPEAFQMHKQDQCTQEGWIKTGLEIYLDHFFIP